MTRTVLARILGVSLRQIAALEAEGTLVPDRLGRGGRSSLYQLERVVPLYLEMMRKQAPGAGHTDRSARAQRELAQAALAEQTYQTRARELLPAAEVEKIWSAEVQAVRSAILATYTTAADRLHRTAILDGVEAVEAELKAMATGLLRELADPDRPLPALEERQDHAA